MVATTVKFEAVDDDQMQALQAAVDARATVLLASSSLAESGGEGDGSGLYADVALATRAVTSDPFEMADVMRAAFPSMSLDQRKIVYRRYMAGINGSGSEEGGGGSAAVPISSPFPMPRVSSMRNALAASGMRPPGVGVADALLNRSASALLLSSPSPGAAAGTALGRRVVHLSADPIVLINNRCPCERVPLMPAHPRRPRAPPTTEAADFVSATALDGAWKQYLRAEDVLARGQIGDEWEAAIEHFEQASHLFERADDWCMAANALVRGADCLRCLFNTDAMASYLDRAAHLYVRYATNPAGDGSASAATTAAAGGLFDDDRFDANLQAVSEAAVQSMMQAVYVALAAGRKAKAAKFCRRGAEVAVDANQHDVAVSFLHRAKDLYAELNMLGEARAAMARAVAICVMDMSDPASAIDTLEKFADVSIPEEQPLVLFRAMICRLACIPDVVGNDTNEAMMDCEYCLDQYTDLCVALCGGKENTCLKQMLRGILEHAPQRIQNAIESYVTCHTLEPWVEPVMRVVWERAIQRLAHQTERTRAIPWSTEPPPTTGGNASVEPS